MTATITTKKRISVPVDEYTRLKQLDKRFGELFGYWEYLKTINDAREEKHGRKGVEQTKLFKQLGLS